MLLFLQRKGEIMIRKLFIVSLLSIIASGITMHAAVEMLAAEHVPGSVRRLSIRSIENQSANAYFKVFYGDSGDKALVLPESTCSFDQGELDLNQNNVLRLICAQGSYLPIYIQDEGRASGQAPAGYHGPYYLSMWLSYPHVADEFKIHVRYAVQMKQIGEIGVRIGPKGECQIVALAHVKLLP